MNDSSGVTRDAMFILYAEALDVGAEGALRFLASSYEERFGREIEDAALDAGWSLITKSGERRLVREA